MNYLLSAVFAVSFSIAAVEEIQFEKEWINSDYVELFLPDYEITISLLLLFLATIFTAQINSAFTAYFQGLRHFKIVNKILIINGIYGLLSFAIAYLLHFYGYYTFRLLDVIAVSFLILVLNTLHWFVYCLPTC